MNAATTRDLTTRTSRARTLSGWRKLTIGALAANALLFLFLVEVVQRFFSKEPTDAAPIVFIIADLLIAGLLWAIPSRWVSLVAAAFILVGTVGAIPHDLPALSDPVGDPGHFIFSVLIFGVGVLGLVASVQSFRQSGQASA